MASSDPRPLRVRIDDDPARAGENPLLRNPRRFGEVARAKRHVHVQWFGGDARVGSMIESDRRFRHLLEKNAGEDARTDEADVGHLAQPLDVCLHVVVVGL